jgi:hypothetical protein
MHRRFLQFWRSGKSLFVSRNDPGFEHSCIGRIINALSFIAVIFFLGLWITIFLSLKDKLFSAAISENILTNLTCLTFFGGLVVAVFIGTLAGNFLRRVFWKKIIRRKGM